MGIFQLIAERLAPEEFNAPNSTLRQVAKGAEDAVFAVVSTNAISSAVITAAHAVTNLGGMGVTGGAHVDTVNLTGATAIQPAKTPVLVTPQAQVQSLPSR